MSGIERGGGTRGRMVGEPAGTELRTCTTHQHEVVGYFVRFRTAVEIVKTRETLNRVRGTGYAGSCNRAGAKCSVFLGN
jgi:hypothetical protein